MRDIIDAVARIPRKIKQDIKEIGERNTRERAGGE